MAVHWNNDELRSFFGTIPLAENVDGDVGRHFWLRYEGQRLKYELIIHSELQTVSISGDNKKPFGPDSLFEITAPCDSITACEGGYYSNQTGLIFWYGDTSQRHNQTMHLLKRPDGDLKVWPMAVWPRRHANFKMLWGESASRHPYKPAEENR